MKNLILIPVFLLCVLGNAQQATITITDAWTDASSANLEQLTEWVVKGELTGVPGTKEYYISDTWNPGNGDLNTILAEGGDTENWPLYWVVNDTNFFYLPVSDVIGDNTVGLRSIVNTPNKLWGDYLRQSHEIYYRSVTTPDQYLILAVDIDGNYLKLSEVAAIRNEYTEAVGYVTLPTLNANNDKVQIIR